MKELSKEELIKTEGGSVESVLNGTILSTLVKGATVFFDIGRSLGSAVRRIFCGNICKL